MSAKSLIGAKVIHITHGKGTIIAFTERPGQTTDIIEVDFDGKAIKYNYPTVFEKYLPLDEEDNLIYFHVVDEDLAARRTSQKIGKNATEKNGFHQTATVESDQENIRNSTNSQAIPSSHTRSTKNQKLVPSSTEKVLFLVKAADQISIIAISWKALRRGSENLPDLITIAGFRKSMHSQSTRVPPQCLCLYITIGN